MTHHKTRLKSILLTAALALLPAATGLATPAPPPIPDVVSGNALIAALHPQAKKDHKHQYRKSSKKVWVSPVYRNKLVGYDKKGRPKYKRVLVKKGYYKTVTAMKCVKCGKTK